jgi:MYXO-CTERM domain-containing protein
MSLPRLVPALSAGLLLAATQIASAHIQVRAPLQRDVEQKNGPCGKAASQRGANICTFRPGQTVTIAFDETIEHPGHYRVAFDDDGQDFLNPTSPDAPLAGPDGFLVLVNNIEDRDANQTGQRYTYDITLPDVECDNCTLQLMQIMTEAETYVLGDFYWQCADIVLSSAAPETPDPNCVAPPEGGGGDEVPDDEDDDGTGAGGGADGIDDEVGDDERSPILGGCRASSGGNTSGTLAAIALLALCGLFRRRR